MLKNIVKRIIRKTFTIDLEDKYCFPNQKDFIYPNSLVLQAVIENYCIKNGIQIEYVKKENPIIFILNGKTKYEAKAFLGHGRYDQGYTVKCIEIIGEKAIH